MTLRESVFRVACATGVLDLIRDSEWRRRRLFIVCYHGVSTRDEHDWNGELYVPPDHLRRRLRSLRDNDYNILPLAEACRRLTEGSLPPRSVAVTFDDGAVDFATTAVPVLREFDVPATVYLASYYSSVRLPVFDTVLSYVLWRGRASGADVGPLCNSPTPLPVATRTEREAARRRIYDFAAQQQLDAYGKDALVADVAARVRVSYADVCASGVLRIMSPEMVEALPRGLIDVQLHTHRHRTPTIPHLFARELRDNARCIRAFAGDRPLTHFCYPNGEYQGAFLPWLKRAGVQYATTCTPGLASANDDPLLLPRLVDNAMISPVSFEAWASGFATFVLPRLAHRELWRRLHSAGKAVPTTPVAAREMAPVPAFERTLAPETRLAPADRPVQWEWDDSLRPDARSLPAPTTGHRATIRELGSRESAATTR